jgi:hypothetical protein
MSEKVVMCPHCNEAVLIYELNCCIFRHGSFKQTFTQMDPHCPKEECDRLVQLGLIYGCGKPFIVTEKDGLLVADICDYI